jgi:hypothetical protein
MPRSTLINTPLQRGVGTAREELNRFSGLRVPVAQRRRETAKRRYFTPGLVAQAFQPVSQVFKPAESAASSGGLRTESPRYSRLESLPYSSPRPTS